MIETSTAQLPIIPRDMRRTGVKVSKDLMHQSYILHGHIHLPEELIGCPYDGKSVTIRFSSDMNEKWLSQIEKERGASGSIGRVQIRKDLEEKEYDFDGEIEVESVIIIDARLPNEYLKEFYHTLEHMKFNNDVTRIYVVMEGNNIPPKSQILDFTPLNDIKFDETKYYSLKSISIL